MFYNGINDYKKNTSEKTINAVFLKELFSEEEFTKHYSLFLKDFKLIIDYDNEKKIISLAKSIVKTIGTNKHAVNLSIVRKYRQFGGYPGQEVFF